MQFQIPVGATPLIPAWPTCLLSGKPSSKRKGLLIISFRNIWRAPPKSVPVTPKALLVSPKHAADAPKRVAGAPQKALLVIPKHVEGTLQTAASNPPRAHVYFHHINLYHSFPFGCAVTIAPLVRTFLFWSAATTAEHPGYFPECSEHCTRALRMQSWHPNPLPFLQQTSRPTPYPITLSGLGTPFSRNALCVFKRTYWRMAHKTIPKLPQFQFFDQVVGYTKNWGVEGRRTQEPDGGTSGYIIQAGRECFKIIELQSFPEVFSQICFRSVYMQICIKTLNNQLCSETFSLICIVVGCKVFDIFQKSSFT